MCGLVFIFDQALDTATRDERARRASELLRHRGPDDSAHVSRTHWSMAHRRLAILNPDSSAQPMTDHTGRFWLSYNGEIYNYRELRSALAPHWSFKTEGDTEVLLAGLALEGVPFLERAEGMWAFAFWDDFGSQLLLARDRMGQKPLYYSKTFRSFACASELPALRACVPNADWSEDPNSTADYFRYGFYLPGTTAYRGIREILPGHTLHWHPGSAPRSRPYWNLEHSTSSTSRASAARQLRRAVVNAVERRTVADVEVGAFLSGGIDSSIIAGTLTSELDRRPRTFTVGFMDESFDERRYAQSVARHFGTIHYERTIDHWDREKLIRLLFEHVGQPFADTSLLPTAEVSAIAAQHLKVALSGDGADELFSGYQRYQARVLLQWYTRLPGSLRSGIARLIRLSDEPTAHHSRSLLKKAHLFVSAAQRANAETPYVAPRMSSDHQLRSLNPDFLTHGHRPPNLPEQCGIEDLERMMTLDSLVYLPQDILAKVDRASMAYGLETRSPFLDSNVINFAFSVPTRWHRKRARGKRMLRSAFSDIIPKLVINRRKQGFGVPVHDWLSRELGQELRRMLADSTGATLNTSTIDRLLQSHASGRRDHSQLLWACYVYMVWKRETN